MKKFDVLFLCQFFYPEYNSSAVLPYQTAEDLVKRGLKVKVVCGYPKEYLAEERVLKKETINGIEIHRINYLQLSRKSKIGRLVNYFSFLFSIICHWFLLIDNKCTIVYSNPPILPLVTAINKKLFRIKYIFVSYEIYPDVALVTKQIKENSIIHNIMLKINKMMDHSVDKIVALSEDMKTYILDNRPDVTENKISIIPNWYDDSELNLYDEIKDAELKDLRKSYELIVLYSGNMGICQDVDVILDAAKKLRDNADILFVFTGHGNKKERLEEEAKKLKLKNVKFYGFLSGQKYIDMLRIADAHIISLDAGIEGICVPSKTYSYMAIGRPMIAIMDNNTDIADDINENGLGFVIEPGNEEQLRKALLDLLSNKNHIESMGGKVRDVYLEKYTRKMSTDKYYEIIKKITN